MYLAELKLWNFRKYGNKNHLHNISKATEPDLIVEFQEKLNVLIGENDSGKTAIIDAIKYVLNTKSLEYLRLDNKDFFEYTNGTSRERARELRIECKFKKFTNAEAGSFLEWIGFDDEDKYELTVWLTATNKDNRIITNIRAGQDDEGVQMDGEARENLKVTYLKPLRDALSELSPGYKSRLAEILGGHSTFKTILDRSNGEKIQHELESKAEEANNLIRKYFKIKNGENTNNTEDVNQKIRGLGEKCINMQLSENNELLDVADVFLETASFIKKGREPEGKGAQITRDVIGLLEKLSFNGTAKEPAFELTDEELKDILKSLKLVNDSNKSGLGSLNKLYMAAEFLLLKQSKGRDLKLALIEELEAHLHPQAQLKIIDALQGEKAITDGQLILTTHSTTLASKVKLDNLILCHGNDVFPMKRGKTKLEEGDYEFLERFLDATKANLFFAKGVIMVEGDAENILIPTIAEIIGRPLQDYGVSIVNVSNAYFFRYVRIFQRNDNKLLGIPVSCISDLDIEMSLDKEKLKPKKEGNIEELQKDAEKRKKSLHDDKFNIKICTSPLWTLEYDILNSDQLTSRLLLQSILEAQLIKNKRDYTGLTSEDTIKKGIAADKKWNKDFKDFSDDIKAFKVYTSYLGNDAVSKAVTAQRFAYHLREHKDKVKEIIKNTLEFNYICEAIYHVTEPPK